MPIVNPSLADFEVFENHAPDDKPIVMVNLLKFRESANYETSEHSPCSGQQAYKRYSKQVLPLLWEVGGQVLWSGRVRASVIVPHDESWDEAVLVQYPCRAAFVKMVRSEVYQRVMVHRTAALHDSRLIETTAVYLPLWILNPLRLAIRAKSLVFPKL